MKKIANALIAIVGIPTIAAAVGFCFVSSTPLCGGPFTCTGKVCLRWDGNTYCNTALSCVATPTATRRDVAGATAGAQGINNLV